MIAGGLQGGCYSDGSDCWVVGFVIVDFVVRWGFEIVVDAERARERFPDICCSEASR